MAKKDKFWCDRDLFTSPIFWAVVFTEEDYNKVIKDLKAPECDHKFPKDSTAGMLHVFQASDGSRAAVLAVDILRWKTEGEPIDLSTVVSLCVHELTHLKQAIMEFIGEPNPSKEFEAYMMQHLAAECMVKLSEYLKRTSASVA